MAGAMVTQPLTSTPLDNFIVGVSHDTCSENS